jgi:hypothetical protein
MVLIKILLTALRHGEHERLEEDLNYYDDGVSVLDWLMKKKLAYPSPAWSLFRSASVN